MALERGAWPVAGPVGSACTADLAQFCGPTTCPTYVTSVASLESRAAEVLVAETGTYGPLKWTKWSTWYAGEIAYFDEHDHMLAVRAWSDTNMDAFPIVAEW